jgi:hypothetical protein
MNDMTIFKDKPVVSYSDNDLESNKGLIEGVGGGMNFIRLSSKGFIFQEDGVKSTPKTQVECILLRCTANMVKNFYKGKYNEKEDPTAPDCASADGVKPDKGIKKPCCDYCADCPNNAWGSGERGGKLCPDRKRLVVCLLGLDDYRLYRIDIPPMSLKPTAAYGKMLEGNNVPLNGVFTRLSLDLSVSYAMLKYDPVRVLDQATYDRVREIMKDSAINDMLTAQVTSEPLQAQKTEKNKKAAAKTAPVSEPVEVDTVGDIEMSPEMEEAVNAACEEEVD